MSKISTHVLDAMLGKPAAGVWVRLEEHQGGGWSEMGDAERISDLTGTWVEIARKATDTDGRCRDLAADAAEGIYRITFETGVYLRNDERRTIYPEIAIVFQCDGRQNYHLPLLLSDNSYTTYRGS
ncbi:MAG TPA: hydroxyisourate hydrolase [Terracidiphilus sp.]|nr:hydroxyisourate hydrolase [Terracidiphilus sp.]